MVGTLVLVLVVSACAQEAGAPSGDQERFAEGEVAVTVDVVDTGLLKGTMSAEAKGGWKVAAIGVRAVDPGDVDWRVLEFPEGLGLKNATGLFEVVLQELPRGQQLTITATATFEDDEGNQVMRTAVDHWPP